MVQTLTGRDVSEAINVFDTTTTGDITIGTGMTSGTASMFSNASRNGSIAIGHPSSSGIISIDSGSSATNLNSSTMTLNTDTGPLTLAPADGQGLSLHGSTSRSGAITMGHASSTGAITIDAGTGQLTMNGTSTTIRSDTGTLAIAPSDAVALTLHNSGTRSGTISMGSNLSTGIILIRTGAGDMTISAASGDITIDAGTGALTLGGSNYDSGTWTAGISDVTGNAGTVGSVTANYSRVDNMVTCSLLMNITSKGSMIAGEEFRLTGLPYASTGSSVSGSVHGPFINSGPTGIYRIFCENTKTTASVRINDSVAPLDRDLLVSEMSTGFIYGTFIYWV